MRDLNPRYRRERAVATTASVLKHESGVSRLTPLRRHTSPNHPYGTPVCGLAAKSLLGAAGVPVGVRLARRGLEPRRAVAGAGITPRARLAMGVAAALLCMKRAARMSLPLSPRSGNRLRCRVGGGP